MVLKMLGSILTRERYTLCPERKVCFKRKLLNENQYISSPLHNILPSLAGLQNVTGPGF